MSFWNSWRKTKLASLLHSNYSGNEWQTKGSAHLLQQVIADDAPLVIVFLQAHSSAVFPDALHCSCPVFFFRIEYLGQKRAQLESLVLLIAHEVDGDVDSGSDE